MLRRQDAGYQCEIVGVYAFIRSSPSSDTTSILPLHSRPFCLATEASLLVFATAAFFMGSRHFYAVVESVQLFMFVQAAWFLAPSLIARFRQTEEQ